MLVFKCDLGHEVYGFLQLPQVNILMIGFTFKYVKIFRFLDTST